MNGLLDDELLARVLGAARPAAYGRLTELRGLHLLVRGVDAAIGDVRAGRGGPVPAHLRDAHYPGAGQLGHGRGYVYSHDAPHGVAGQQYAPDDLVGREYYAPTDRGAERGVRERLERIRALLRGG